MATMDPRSAPPRSRWSVALALIAALLFGILPARAESETISLQCGPLPLAGDLTRVAYGNGEYIGLNQRRLLVSADGERWSVRSTGLGAELRDILFADGHFTAVGSNGQILRSADGRRWSVTPSGTFESLSRLAHGGGTYVAISSSGTVALSRDGSTWTTQSLGRYSLQGVAYGDGQFVLVSAAGIFASRDGSAWEMVYADAEDPYAHFIGVTYGQGKFAALLAGGEVLLSQDGRTWEKKAIPAGERPLYAHLNDLTYGNGRFMIVGNQGTVLLSRDGQTWNGVPLGMKQAHSRNLRTVSAVNGRFIAGGDRGLILTSTDGQSWTETNPMVERDHFLYALAYGNRQFVAAGGDSVMLSADGYDWQACSLGGKYALMSLSYDGARFLATGVVDDYRSASRWRVFTSADGRTWSVLDPKTERSLTAIASDRRHMVAVGDGGTILTSVDGSAWTTAAVEKQVDLTDVIYANGLFVATGRDGVVLTSPDALSWTARPSGVYYELTEVLYDGCQYTAHDDSDWSASYDGQHWTAGETPQLADRLAVGGGWWATADSYGYISLSSDGSSWTRTDAAVSDPIGGVYGQGRFVFVSSGGAVTVVEAPERQAAPCDRSLTDLFRLHPAEEAIRAVVKAGMMQPDATGAFRPDGDLTRAELAHLLVLVAGAEPAPKESLPFIDLEGHPAAQEGYIQTAIKLKLMEGLRDRFYPDAATQLTDFLTGMGKAAGLTPLDHRPEGYMIVADGSEGWVAAVVEAGLVGTEAPWPIWTDPWDLARGFRVTRGEAATVLANLLVRQGRVQPDQPGS